MTLSKPKLVVLAIVAATPIAALIVIMLPPAHKLAGIGEPCTNNVFCDSSECLPREPAKERPHGGFETPNPNAPGVCTTPCTRDAGCPRTMRCGGVIELALFPGIGYQDRDPMRRRCIPRDW